MAAIHSILDAVWRYVEGSGGRRTLLWVRRGYLLARKVVKPGKERGLEEPVWERVTGQLLGAARWVGRDGGRRGGLGLSRVVCAGGIGVQEGQVGGGLERN
jgi:hypothetical protein